MRAASAPAISGKAVRIGRDGRAHLAAAVRYDSLNPVRVRLVAHEDWRWSSVRAHLYGRDDGLTTRGPVLERW